MTDSSLMRALQKLDASAQKSCSASRLTPAQREALARFAQQTGCVQLKPSGNGVIYQVTQAQTFTQHLVQLNPASLNPVDRRLPQRTQNLAQARDSKFAAARHPTYSLQLKASGQNIQWHNTCNNVTLELSQATENYGGALLQIDPSDAWHSQSPLWLVENKLLFDRLDWLPQDTHASICYYAGHLNTQLIDWLTKQNRAPQIVLFPDYDGIGLLNFVRLHRVLKQDVHFWLMDDWQHKLQHYGNQRIWRNTRKGVLAAHAYFSQHPSDHTNSVLALIEQMKTTALTLEQEAIWLS